MSDNSKTTPNDVLSFELGAWLDHTQQLDQAATEGPWEAGDASLWGDDDGVPQAAVLARGGPITWDDHAGDVFKPADAEWIVHARQALPAATAAIRAVLDLHQPEFPRLSTPYCTVCEFEELNLEWPCPTVKAMQGALCPHTQRGITRAEGSTTAYACATCEHEWIETRNQS